MAVRSTSISELLMTDHHKSRRKILDRKLCLYVLKVLFEQFLEQVRIADLDKMALWSQRITGVVQDLISGFLRDQAKG